MILKNILLIKDFKKILFFLTTVLLVINIHYSVFLFYLCSLLILVEYLLYGKKDQFKINLKRSFPIVIYFIFLSFSIAYSNNKVIAYKILEKNLIFIVFPLIFSLNSSSSNLFLEKKFYQALLVGVIIIFVVNLVYLDLDYNLFSYYNTHKNFFKLIPAHPTYIGLFIFISVLYYYDFSFNLKKKLIIHTFLSLASLFLMSRIIIVLYVLFFAYDLYFILKKTTTTYKVLTCIITIFSLAYIFFQTPYLKERIISDSLMDLNLEDGRSLDKGASEGSSRILRYKSAIQVINENILIGTGIGDAQSKLNDAYTKNNLKIAANKNYNTHNQYLDILVKLGLAGLTILTLIFYLSLKSSYSKNITLIICSFILIMLVENLLGRFQGVFCFVSAFSFMLMNNRIFIKQKNNLTN